MGDGVDRDVGRDVASVVSAGDEVLVAVGVGDGVGFCLVGTWIVESGCGFSDGDYLRSGAIAGKSLIIDEIIKAANSGCLVLGICNGFQILTETGLLKGTLLRNKNLKFINKDVNIKVVNNNTKFSNAT